MSQVTFREAIKAGLHEILSDDPLAFIMGEDVGHYGGTYAITKGFVNEFGEHRVIDTPISESGFVGAGIGAAWGGMHPIVEVMTVNFSLLALDQIINNAATMLHMSGGQFNTPLVIRMSTGAGKQLAAQHSHSWEGWYAHIPGIKILTPSTPQDAYEMVRYAVTDPDPILIFEHATLFNKKGELQTDLSPDESVFKARIKREGEDLTIVAYNAGVWRALDAAEDLAEIGIDAEVIDLRSLRPIDEDTILESIKKTNRCLIVDEGWKSVSLSSEISARIAEKGFYDLDAPIGRCCSAEVPIPDAKHLEEAATPQKADIITVAREILNR